MILNASHVMYIFSDTCYRSKIGSIVIPMGTAFYNCNKRDFAGAELKKKKKHAALSNSQWEYKMLIFSLSFS